MFHQEPAILFSHASSLEPGGGGVQRCTRSYSNLLASAGFDLSPVSYEYDRSLHLRLLRRLRPRPYDLQIPAGSAEKVFSHASRIGAKWIFLNHGDTVPLAAQMEALAPGRHRFVLLSHGADSTDFLHEVRIRRSFPRSRDKLWLGAQLFAEAGQRPHLHAVLCLSEQDLHLERWFGARNVLFLPQIASGSPLEGFPVKNRIGTVCTMNHAPNDEGLALFARALQAHSTIRLRLVGRPSNLGYALAAEFPNLDYLGPLDDHALEKEAGTWACFVNPIFCQGRGASTKLAQALGWQLPIATTRAGARGYLWDESLIPLAETPEVLAAQAAELAALENYEKNREKVRGLIRQAPGRLELTQRLAQFLSSIP